MPYEFPQWLTWYKKPEYRDFREYATHISSGRRPVSPNGSVGGGIPHRLRLDRILANKTCSPMSLYDFYMYLKYIEYSAENLEFYVWFKNYEATYDQATPIDSKDYGSIRSAAQSTSSVARITQGDGDSGISVAGKIDADDNPDSEAAQETLARISNLISTTALCASKSTCSPDAISAPSRVASFLSPFSAPCAKPATTPLTTTSINSQAPTPQSELSTIISLFLLPSSPKELNIPAALRTQALADLTTTNGHPSALRPVAEHVYSLLHSCSHRNFVRLGVGNGTFETVCAASVLGWISLLAGFVVVLCRALAVDDEKGGGGRHSRWETFAAWPLWWLGMSLVLSGLRGSCFFLLLLSRRQRLPWERFDDGEEDAASLRRGSSDDRKGEKNGMAGWFSGNRRLGGGGGSGEGGLNGLIQWVKRVMIFDRRIRVQERELRRLQRKIVFQSLTGGALFATVCVLLFLWLPVWRETV
ncbi:hypothetical protein B0J18DRAFT_484933 [Chaetomium sp. MPI-SDFR-AT-0129]|nr:hypothetical protein B0J18DRAFT_484933 [Chaetomium sp. MPI-SDFR-AT-0129]